MPLVILSIIATTKKKGKVLLVLIDDINRAANLSLQKLKKTNIFLGEKTNLARFMFFSLFSL